MKYLFLLLLALLLLSPIEASKGRGCRCPCKCVRKAQAWKQCEKKFRIRRGCKPTEPRFCRRSKLRRRQRKTFSCCCSRVSPTKPMTTTTTRSMTTASTTAQTKPTSSTTTTSTTTKPTSSSTTTSTTTTTTTKKPCPCMCYEWFRHAKDECRKWEFKENCEVEECDMGKRDIVDGDTVARDVVKLYGFYCCDKKPHLE